MLFHQTYYGLDLVQTEFVSGGLSAHVRLAVGVMPEKQKASKNATISTSNNRIDDCIRITISLHLVFSPYILARLARLFILD